MIALAIIVGTWLLGAATFFGIIAAVVFICVFFEEVVGIVGILTLIAAVLYGISYGVYEVGQSVIAAFS